MLGIFPITEKIALSCPRTGHLAYLFNSKYRHLKLVCGIITNNIHETCQFLKTTSKLNDSKYRKVPKISPGAYIFQRPFLRGLFLEWLI